MPKEQPLRYEPLGNAKIVSKKKISQAFSFSRRKTSDKNTGENFTFSPVFATLITEKAVPHT